MLKNLTPTLADLQPLSATLTSQYPKAIQLAGDRMGHALNLLTSGFVTQVGENYFAVKSESNPARTYYVQNATCTCPDHRAHGKAIACKHRLAVQLYREFLAAQNSPERKYAQLHSEINTAWRNYLDAKTIANDTWRQQNAASDLIETDQHDSMSDDHLAICATANALSDEASRLDALAGAAWCRHDAIKAQILTLLADNPDLPAVSAGKAACERRTQRMDAVPGEKVEYYDKRYSKTYTYHRPYQNL